MLAGAMMLIAAIITLLLISMMLLPRHIRLIRRYAPPQLLLVATSAIRFDFRHAAMLLRLRHDYAAATLILPLRHALMPLFRRYDISPASPP